MEQRRCRICETRFWCLDKSDDDLCPYHDPSRRKPGTPVKVKVWRLEELCPHCKRTPMLWKQPNAKYCSDKCQRAAYKLKWRAENKAKHRVHKMVETAVKNGSVKPSKNCQFCKKEYERIYGHHDDYNKPYELLWLCGSCHKKRHRDRESIPPQPLSYS